MTTTLQQIVGEGALDASIKKILNDNADRTVDLASDQTISGLKTLSRVPAGAGGQGDRSIKTAVTAINGAALHAAILAWQNPESVAIVILRAFLHIRTVATGACTVDVGVTEVNATTTSDTLLDGIDANAATGVFDSMNAALDSGANAKAQLLAAAKWVTIDEKTGDSTGMVADLYVQYVLAAA